MVTAVKVEEPATATWRPERLNVIHAIYEAVLDVACCDWGATGVTVNIGSRHDERRALVEWVQIQLTETLPANVCKMLIQCVSAYE